MLNDLLVLESAHLFNEFMNSKNFNICENTLIKKHAETVSVRTSTHTLFDFNGPSIVIAFLCTCTKTHKALFIWLFICTQYMHSVHA